MIFNSSVRGNFVSVLWERLQPRLPRVVREGEDGERPDALQLRHAAFPSEEGPGTSVFHKDGAGNVFHTYSSYGRGLDMLIEAYNWLDLAPKGRDETGLAYTMAWGRHHDNYSEGRFVDPKAQ